MKLNSEVNLNEIEKILHLDNYLITFYASTCIDYLN